MATNIGQIARALGEMAKRFSMAKTMLDEQEINNALRLRKLLQDYTAKFGYDQMLLKAKTEEELRKRQLEAQQTLDNPDISEAERRMNEARSAGSTLGQYKGTAEAWTNPDIRTPYLNMKQGESAARETGRLEGTLKVIQDPYKNQLLTKYRKSGQPQINIGKETGGKFNAADELSTAYTELITNLTNPRIPSEAKQAYILNYVNKVLLNRARMMAETQGGDANQYYKQMWEDYQKDPKKVILELATNTRFGVISRQVSDLIQKGYFEEPFGISPDALNTPSQPQQGGNGNGQSPNTGSFSW